KTPSPIPPKNIEQLHYSYESDNPFDGPPIPHKPDKLRSARIDRLESIMGKVADTMGSVADSNESELENTNLFLAKLDLEKTLSRERDELTQIKDDLVS
ncbi:18427_t:CDS:2, partial [Racocetra fulgida]